METIKTPKPKKVPKQLPKKSDAIFDTNEENADLVTVKSAPDPLVPDTYSKESLPLKVQISAPSNWHSLKDAEAAPFKKPGRVIKPSLLTGSIMNEDEAVLMIAASEGTDGLAQFLSSFLVDKKVVANYNLVERNFLISLIKETINHASIHEFNASKLACLITLYLATHLFFKRFYYESRENVWNYFKEILVRHTIEQILMSSITFCFAGLWSASERDSPYGQEIFQPEESYDILSHFHTLYLSNLPLIHILSFGCCRLKFEWPYKK